MVEKKCYDSDILQQQLLCFQSLFSKVFFSTVHLTVEHGLIRSCLLQFSLFYKHIFLVNKHQIPRSLQCLREFAHTTNHCIWQ